MAIAPNITDPGMELHDLLLDREFLERRNISNRAEKRFEALQRLAGVFTESQEVVLQKLVEIAVEFCGADSAGISLEEPDEQGNPVRFRWVAISGSFSQYLNGTTPRFFSPCGTCLSTGRPQHYRVTKPYYDFLGVVAEPINDGMLIPWTSDESRGTIWAISHGSPETFDSDDYKLLHTLADFAGISVRLAERDRRSAKDLQALQRIQEVTTRLVGSHDLHSRLAEILSAAADLTGTDKGNIQLYDSDCGVLRIVTHQGFGPRFLQHFSTQGCKFISDQAAGKIERVIWKNIAEEPELQGTEDLDVMIGDGIRAIQSTPLVSLDGRLLGSVNNHFRTPHRPSEQELRYLDLLARLAAGFIEGWQTDQLLRLREQRFREQARLLNLSNDAIIARANDGQILYWNEGAERLYGWKSAEAVGKNIHKFLQTKFPVPQEEIHMQLRGAGHWTGELVHTKRNGERVTVLCRKIADRDDDGRMTVLETNTDISHRKAAEEQLQQSHDELEAQVEQRTMSLRLLSAALLRVQDEERRKIARELHDSVGQYLAALKMNLAQIERRSPGDSRILTDSEQLLDQCLAETRTISHLLHPPLLDESGLPSATKWYLEGFSTRSGIEVSLDIHDRVGRLPQDVETALFRVLQESLTNVHRHSGSKKVDIVIRLDGGEALITIRDYGCGFSPQQLQDVRNSRSRGLGLTGLRERIAVLGGLLEVVSVEPGSLIKVTLPLAHDDARADSAQPSRDADSAA